MPTLNYSGANLFGGQEIPMIVFVVYGLVWLFTLGLCLTRSDLDPVTRLMWVVVVIFVPVFGLLLYYVLSPARRPFEPNMDRHKSADLAGTPWEKNPGHRIRRDS